MSLKSLKRTFGIFFILIFFTYFMLYVLAYTPDPYTTINLTLGDGSYTPDSYDDINLTLNELVGPVVPTDTCTCPAVPANYTINTTDECFFNTDCNIDTYNLSIIGETGNVSINSTFTFGHLFSSENISGILYPNAKMNQSIT